MIISTYLGNTLLLPRLHMLTFGKKADKKCKDCAHLNTILHVKLHKRSMVLNELGYRLAFEGMLRLFTEKKGRTMAEAK